MRGKLAQAKVAQQQLSLAQGGEGGGKHVPCCALPQLHGASRPAVLLLAVGKETGGKLQDAHVKIKGWQSSYRKPGRTCTNDSHHLT